MRLELRSFALDDIVLEIKVCLFFERFSSKHRCWLVLVLAGGSEKYTDVVTYVYF